MENDLAPLLMNELERASETENEISSLGIEVIPIDSGQYPKIHKVKLKTKLAPPDLCGNIGVVQAFRLMRESDYNLKR